MRKMSTNELIKTIKEERYGADECLSNALRKISNLGDYLIENADNAEIAFKVQFSLTGILTEIVSAIKHLNKIRKAIEEYEKPIVLTKEDLEKAFKTLEESKLEFKRVKTMELVLVNDKLEGFRIETEDGHVYMMPYWGD